MKLGGWKSERMVLRYVGPDGMKYLKATSGLPRVTFTIQVEQLTSWNGQGLDRSFSAESCKIICPVCKMYPRSATCKASRAFCSTSNTAVPLA